MTEKILETLKTFVKEHGYDFERIIYECDLEEVAEALNKAFQVEIEVVRNEFPPVTISPIESVTVKELDYLKNIAANVGERI